jgi:hypothetical protein
VSTLAVVLVKFVAAWLLVGIVTCAVVLGLLAIRFIPAGAGSREIRGRRNPRRSPVVAPPTVH